MHVECNGHNEDSSLQTNLFGIVCHGRLVHSMEEGSVAHNCAASPTRGEALTHVDVQELLADLINKLLPQFVIGGRSQERIPTA